MPDKRKKQPTLYPPPRRRRHFENMDSSQFAAYYDFSVNADQTPPDLPLPRYDPEEMLVQACQRWIERGGLIVRAGWGIRTVRVKIDGRGLRSGFYRASKYCCPLGALLNKQESHFSPIDDARKLLDVDEYWIVGFVHSISNTFLEVIGKQLRDHYLESKTYCAGRDCAERIASRFIRIPAGWLAEGNSNYGF